MTISKQIIDDFFEIPIGFPDDLVQDLADGLECVIREYTSFVASCGNNRLLLLCLRLMIILVS